jgi:DNA-binding MurR/RpiR family transcriptional regulator
MVTQLARCGLDTDSLTDTGILFADDVQKLRKGDLLFILAYGRIYSELAVLLYEVRQHQIESLLVTGTLAANKMDLILPVPRGRAEMLSMHTAILALIEALLVGVASQRPAQTLASLEELNELRQRLTGVPTNLSDDHS